MNFLRSVPFRALVDALGLEIESVYSSSSSALQSWKYLGHSCKEDPFCLFHETSVAMSDNHARPVIAMTAMSTAVVTDGILFQKTPM